MWRIAGYLTTSGKPRYYIGGTTAGDPYYTHSAESSEEFRSLVPHGKRPLSERKAFIENPPPGISRRILKKFDVITEENKKEIKNKVWKTENKFLLNRKERCWDRYYNVGTGNPFYIDMSGKNNPNYINGVHVGRKSPDPKVRRQAEWKRDQVPKRREQLRLRKKKHYWSKPAGHRNKSLKEIAELGTLDEFLVDAEE